MGRHRKAVNPDSLGLAGVLAELGLNLLKQSKWGEAEVCSRELLAILDQTTPDHWSRYQAMSQLGGAMLGQGRCVEAEPPIIQGYEGLEARRTIIPVPFRSRFTEAERANPPGKTLLNE